jgi:taurine dioxygenase
VNGSGAFIVAPLAPGLPFGAVVRDLALASLQDAEIREALRDLWLREGVVVFHDFEGQEAQLALSRCFGALISHPTRETRAQHPELMTVRYKPETGWLMDVDGEERGVWLPWHSDLIYMDRINHGGILRPIVVPDRLGETGFIDKIHAYASLSEALKRRIEGLCVIYKYDLNPEHQRFGRQHAVQVTRFSPDVLSVQNRLDDFPRVLHPMVYFQSETGRPVLNVSPWFAVGIHGMENAEGDALLEEICQHIIHDRFAYFHKWRLGEMVLWDNWRVLHSASGCPADQERWMERTTIEGDYGHGRMEAGAQRDGNVYIHV